MENKWLDSSSAEEDLGDTAEPKLPWLNNIVQFQY